GNRAFYSLSGPDVFSAWRAVRKLAEARLGDVHEIVQQYLTDREQLQGITPTELAARLEEDDGVLVLDVRPEREYRTGHIPGARSIPIETLEERLGELSGDQQIVAYCRGPYCVFSDEAVRRLRAEGFDVKRLEGGLPDWAAEGRPVKQDTALSQ
ncbi:MAG: rhodanese-like domain-containing protein, partial [Gemmatimonadota bacterium]